MTNKHKINPQKQLINLIHNEVRNRGVTLRDLAEHLKLSYIYMTSITCGARKVTGLSLENQRKLADFVGISMVEFLLLSGVLCEEDFNSAGVA